MYITQNADPGLVSFQNSNIYDNDGEDVYVDCCGYSGMELDFRYSYWGETTTAEMNEGDNPKNISQIRDWYDYGEQGMIVNYAGWVQSENTPEVNYSLIFDLLDHLV